MENHNVGLKFYFKTGRPSSMLGAECIEIGYFLFLSAARDMGILKWHQTQLVNIG